MEPESIAITFSQFCRYYPGVFVYFIACSILYLVQTPGALGLLYLNFEDTSGFDELKLKRAKKSVSDLHISLDVVFGLSSLFWILSPICLYVFSCRFLPGGADIKEPLEFMDFAGLYPHILGSLLSLSAFGLIISILAFILLDWHEFIDYESTRTPIRKGLMSGLCVIATLVSVVGVPVLCSKLYVCFPLPGPKFSEPSVSHTSFKAPFEVDSSAASIEAAVIASMFMVNFL